MTATKVGSYEDITFDVLADAVDECLAFQYNNFAPLGKSSPSLIICGVNGNERRKGVSLRLHSGGIEMLVCDWEGNFLFYGKFDAGLQKDEIKAEFFRIFQMVKDYIEQPF